MLCDVVFLGGSQSPSIHLQPVAFKSIISDRFLRRYELYNSKIPDYFYKLSCEAKTAGKPEPRPGLGLSRLRLVTMFRRSIVPRLLHYPPYTNAPRQHLHSLSYFDFALPTVIYIIYMPYMSCSFYPS